MEIGTLDIGPPKQSRPSDWRCGPAALACCQMNRRTYRSHIRRLSKP